MSQRLTPCKGCGCSCHYCNDQVGLHLHAEIENLKQRLIEREDHIVKMETNFLKEAEKFPNGEMAAISEELLTWQDKYSRLYEAHKRVQKVNQNLEDKLLRIVDKCETEKNALTTEVGNLTRRLVDEKFNVARLQEENERYRNDVNLAIQLLQCKPSNFVSQKYDSLPSEMQQKVRNYLSSKRRQSDGNGNMANKPEVKTIKVPIPTFPPTAMVYSVNRSPVEKESNNEDKNHQPPVDIVSAAIMAKVLEEREKERSQTKHCETCTCCKNSTKQSKYTQTTWEVICEQNNKLSGKTQVSSALSVRNRGSDKDLKGSDSCDFTVLATERAKSSDKLPTNNNWDIDVDSLFSIRVQKDTRNETVTEGILVNIESAENSSMNSLTSDSSASSWQSKNATADLISFDNKPLPKSAGPRHCSVRMQAGSNNILLDNVVDPYTPVLYKSRNNDAMVHSTRSRSDSSNSSGDEPISRKSAFRTETEI